MVESVSCQSRVVSVDGTAHDVRSMYLPRYRNDLMHYGLDLLHQHLYNNDERQQHGVDSRSV
jgi:hypothetical protein